MHAKLALVVFLFAAACQLPSGATATESAVDTAAAKPSAGQAKAKVESAADKAKKKQKELRSKKRELENAAIEHRIAKVDRDIRVRAARAALQKATADLEAAEKAMQNYMSRQRPREIEQHDIRIDRRTHSADHAKDELGELTAMYDADEFAKATKELVLKRGRRSLEMAQRELAVAKQELAEFREYTMPKRERELRQKIDDARVAVKKAELETEKAAMQEQLALKKEKASVSDLEEAIRELQAAVKGKS